MGRRVPSSVIHQAHEWYMAAPERRIADAAKRFGVSTAALGARFREAGLAAKPRRWEQVRPSPLPRAVLHRAVIDAYRAGAAAEELGPRFGLHSTTVLHLLEEAGEACASCGILFREDVGGIAVSGGSQVCQDCATVYGLSVERWEREPVDVVSDYLELAACYACEGLR